MSNSTKRILQPFALLLILIVLLWVSDTLLHRYADKLGYIAYIIWLCVALSSIALIYRIVQTAVPILKELGTIFAAQHSTPKPTKEEIEDMSLEELEQRKRKKELYIQSLTPEEASQYRAGYSESYPAGRNQGLKDGHQFGYQDGYYHAKKRY